MKKTRNDRNHSQNKVAGLLSLIVLLNISAFALLVFRDETAPDFGALLVAGILCLLIVAHYLILTTVFKRIDRQILMIVYLLISVGMIMQYRINVDIAYKQLIWIAMGMCAMIIAIVVFSYMDFWIKMRWSLIILAVVLLMAVMLMGITRGGAKNWFDIGGFSFQPSEFVKIVLVIALAAWLSETQNFVRLWPLIAFVVACVGMLVLSRDLGMALIYCLTTLMVYFCASGNYLTTLLGLGVGSVAAVGSYYAFSHVRVRVAAWRNPWASFQSNGFQIAQGLMAIASGGLFGMGLTRGTPKIIPAYHTDYIFAVICEEMGIIVGIALMILYLVLVLRCFSAAHNSKNGFASLLAVGITCVFGIQTFLILGGVIKMIPLTGVTMPFVSYGGSSIIASFILAGIVLSVTIANNNDKKARNGERR